jgi:hypothetical protein
MIDWPLQPFWTAIRAAVFFPGDHPVCAPHYPALKAHQPGYSGVRHGIRRVPNSRKRRRRYSRSSCVSFPANNRSACRPGSPRASLRVVDERIQSIEQSQLILVVVPGRVDATTPEVVIVVAYRRMAIWRG